jgi:hypothetical protein
MAYTFVPASGGQIPPGAWPDGQGSEGEGTPLWVARASLGGGLHLGKVRPGFGAALIPFGGQEVRVNDYEVLMEPGIWNGAIRDGQADHGIPTNAIVCGHEPSGDPLFAARSAVGGAGVQPGKTRFGFAAASIGLGGREVFLGQFAVLVSGQ